MEAFLPESQWVENHMPGDGALVHVAGGGARGCFVTGGSDLLLLVLDAATLLPAHHEGVGHHESGVTCLAAPAGGGRVATGCEDGHIRVLALPGGELQHLAARLPTRAVALAFSSSGGLLAAGDDGEVRVLRVPAAADGAVSLVASLASRSPTRSVAFSPAVRAALTRFQTRFPPRAVALTPRPLLCPHRGSNAGGAAAGDVPRGRQRGCVGRGDREGAARPRARRVRRAQ